ncbi:hypothetical protein BDN72DRAFT_866363 [Pluteus cervinus]|uniref:Uncharacterized protein n=1 Tax=Pluteus cervinus TaxID=181527 RepID=A0ACD2ZX53_9AGAR|nr:hypothetical protein BDN72DRAFT_866363 [Pluteus cervinus]
MGQFIGMKYRFFANLRLIEIVIPPSCHFATRFGNVLPLTGITQLNLHTGHDDDFVDKVRSIARGFWEKRRTMQIREFRHIRYLRIKHITPFDPDPDSEDEEMEDDEGEDDEGSDGDRDMDSQDGEAEDDEVSDGERDDKALRFPLRWTCQIPKPWMHEGWLSIFKGFPHLRVFFLNTPLLLTRAQNEINFVKTWMEPTKKIERVYIYHGYDERAKFMATMHMCGDQVLLEKTTSDWRRIEIRSEPMSRRGSEDVIRRVLVADQERFGPDEDVGTAFNLAPEDMGDDPDW